MMNPTKFGSLNLDTPRISYEFLNFASKSRNHLQKNKNCLNATCTQLSAPAPTDARALRSTGPTR